MSNTPDVKQYDGTPFRRCERSGIFPPPSSVGFRQELGDAFLSDFKSLDQIQKGP